MKQSNMHRIFSKGAVCALLLCLASFLAGCPTVAGMYGEAYYQYLGHDESRALGLLEQIIAKDARYTPAYVLEAAIYETRGDWNKSEETLRLAQQAGPPSPIVCFNLGNVYFKKADYRKAVDEYTRALALNPAFAEAYLNRANAHMDLKEYEAALRDYESFLGLAKEDNPNVRALVKLLREDLKSNESQDPALPR
jgi:tetratricopeptide (TPR) repeat protein